MRHRKTKKPHGIVRDITSIGTITEATWVDGITHGLVRNLTEEEGEVDIVIDRHSEEIEWVSLDLEFNVTKRKTSPQDLLADFDFESLKH